MAGAIQRRMAGDDAETIWESGDLVAKPQTEEEWDKWEEFWKLVKTADGKGLTDQDLKSWKSGYDAALGNYLDTTYETKYADAGWSREDFDRIYDMFEGTPAGESFRNGQLGTDMAALEELGPRAMSSESLNEFQAKQDLESNENFFEGIEAPDLQEFTPELYKTGDKLDLQTAEFDEMDPTKWGDENSAMHGSLDYMRNVMNGGEDDAANAEWNKRKAEAEQLSRANREASMQAMEVQGMAGSGNELLADLEGQGQLTQSLYGAGLDAAGMQQQRRDAAAGTAYEMGGGIADKQDAWHVMTTQRDDANKVYADGIANQESTMNWNRGNQVSDANVPLVNGAEMYNIHDIPMQEFGNDLTVAGAKAGQGVNLANISTDWGQFNTGADMQDQAFQATQPNGWDYATTGVGLAGSVLAGLGTFGVGTAAGVAGTVAQAKKSGVIP